MLLIIIISMFLFESCEKSTGSSFKIVKMTGGDIYTNLSKNNLFGSGDHSEITNYKDSVHAEIMEEGDLLYIQMEDSSYYYRYYANDGEFLTFSKANSNLLVNGIMKSMWIDHEDNPVYSINTEDEEVIKNLQSIMIPDSITQQSMSDLRRIATINPSLGLIFDEYFEGGDSIFSLFDPTWMVCSEINFTVSGMNNLSQIFIFEGDSMNFYKLNGLPSLRKIIIYQNDPVVAEDIKVNNRLQSLTITANINNLSFIKKFPNLEELNIINSDTTIDISAVTDLKKLRIFHLPPDVVTPSLTPLDDLTSLEWMSFPANTSDNDLRSFIAYHKDLRVVGISNEDHVVDLQPLQSLESLCYLNIYGDTLDLNNLYELKHLKYLSISSEILYDSIYYNQLKANLPQTVIVPNDIGICLGTGWLLLFIPVMAFIYLLLLYFREKV